MRIRQIAEIFYGENAIGFSDFIFYVSVMEQQYCLTRYKKNNVLLAFITS
jgi:hypothetical protein